MVVQTEALTKKYGRFIAADSVNLNVEEGAIYGMIGRNGAGKTTILKMIAGLAKPSSGEVCLFGESSFVTNQKNLYEQLGILIEAPGIYGSFDAYHNLKMKCILYGIDNDEYIQKLLNLVGLRSAGKKPVKKFSLGMKQRMGIALAMVGDPKLIILDEPTNGLDPQGVVEIRNLIQKLNQEKGITFIISSHALGELEKVATHYGIIHEGHLIKELTAEEMEKESCGDLENYYFSMTGGVANDECS